MGAINIKKGDTILIDRDSLRISSKDKSQWTMKQLDAANQFLNDWVYSDEETVNDPSATNRLGWKVKYYVHQVGLLCSILLIFDQDSYIII